MQNNTFQKTHANIFWYLSQIRELFKLHSYLSNLKYEIQNYSSKMFVNYTCFRNHSVYLREWFHLYTIKYRDNNTFHLFFSFATVLSKKESMENIWSSNKYLIPH